LQLTEAPRFVPPKFPAPVGPAGLCNGRGVIRDSRQRHVFSMPPRASALPDTVTSALRPVQLPRQPHVRLVITRILRPLPRPTARRAAVPAPPGSAPLHRRPPRRPPPAAKMLRAPACGIVIRASSPCLRPPRIPQRCCKKALRERLTCRRAAVARAATSGRYGVKCCPRHSRRFRTPIVVCAAWSFLRDHLTPRPAVAKSTYRFCVRKIRCSPALQNIGNHGAGESPPILGCRAKSAGQAWFRPSSASGVRS